MKENSHNFMNASLTEFLRSLTTVIFRQPTVSALTFWTLLYITQHYYALFIVT